MNCRGKTIQNVPPGAKPGPMTLINDDEIKKIFGKLFEEALAIFIFVP